MDPATAETNPGAMSLTRLMRYPVCGICGSPRRVVSLIVFTAVIGVPGQPRFHLALVPGTPASR
jgi:hypothetical protein